jgi:hypothetical protein
MAKAAAKCVEWKGQRLTLREFADLVGISHGTIARRWTLGDRGERLGRPIAENQSRNQHTVPKQCVINSLLAGWKSVPTASEPQIGDSPSARSA